MNDLFDTLRFDSHGLIPAIIADHQTHAVLMVAWMNRESLGRTLETGRTHFFSRSRNKLWMKGEESGHVQHVKSVRTDCDADALLIEVEQVGVACHEGFRSCFYRELNGTTWQTAAEREVDPAAVYGKKV
jgi:phosphoribosyl-AMP cyclohydrolase